MGVYMGVVSEIYRNAVYIKANSQEEALKAFCDWFASDEGKEEAVRIAKNSHYFPGEMYISSGLTPMTTNWPDDFVNITADSSKAVSR